MKLRVAIAGNPGVLIISPHTKVHMETTPTEGVESRVSSIVRMLARNSRDILIIEPSDLKSKNEKNRMHFYSFNFIKIKNMRLGSYFLSLNPFYHLALFRALKRRDPDVILISQPWGVFSTWFVVKKIFQRSLLIIHDSHNVESEYPNIIMKDSSIPKVIKLFYRLSIGWIEKLAVKYADYTFAISYENKKTFVRKYNTNPERIRVVPPVIPMEVSISSRGRPEKKSSEIWAVFHGIYRTVQNREAFELIMHKLAPRFKKYKNFKFIVFGKGLLKFDKENVVSFGFVDNVWGVLERCDIAVVPLVSGEGVKLKMLDYIAVGLPIVTTKKGAEGLELVNGKHAIIVDDVNEEFVRVIKYLMYNPKARKKMQVNIKKLFELYFSSRGDEIETARNCSVL